MEQTILAENHTRITKSLFNEGMRAVENQDYKKSVKRLALFLLILFCAAAAWLLYNGGTLIFLLGEAVFLGALLFWLSIMLPHTKRSSKYKAMTHNSHAAPERTVLFYPEHLSVQTGGEKETVIPYDGIRDWQETKHLYILNCWNNTSVLVDKQGFVSGGFPSIEPLLPCPPSAS